MATCILSFLSMINCFNQQNVKPIKLSRGKHCKNLFKTIKTLSYEHVSNEQKAKEIAENIVGNDRYSYFDNFKQCTLQAMQWKDKQFAQEKQQWITNVCKWLRMTMDFFNNGEFNTEKFVNDFKKEMKGE